MSHPSIVAIWRRYRSANPGAPAGHPLVEHFCDNEKDADMCVDLILAGVKRATSSALVEYEMAGEPPPRTGKLIILTDWAGTAKALLRTRAVAIRRFADVPASFAAIEGEGDASLAQWREAHAAFWRRNLAHAGLAVDDDFLVVCEEFDVLLGA